MAEARAHPQIQREGGGMTLLAMCMGAFAGFVIGQIWACECGKCLMCLWDEFKEWRRKERAAHEE
jgi:hypothetical protein